ACRTRGAAAAIVRTAAFVVPGADGWGGSEPGISHSLGNAVERGTGPRRSAPCIGPNCGAARSAAHHLRVDWRRSGAVDCGDRGEPIPVGGARSAAARE